MQQEEIKIFTEELKEGKKKLEQQLKSQMELFNKNSEKALDAERFGQITRGLHVSTTVEEKFEEVSASYNFQKEGNLLYKISNELVLVNGPDASVDILSTKDLKVLHNLNTDAQMAFCACQAGNLLYVGCNNGKIFIYDADKDYEPTGQCEIRKEKVSQIALLELDDNTQTKLLIVCQDKGYVDIIPATASPDVISPGFHNVLGMIYKIEKLPLGEKDKNYQYALATNNGVAILSIKRDASLKQKLESTRYMSGKVINNLLVSKGHILAFQHDASSFTLIDRVGKKVEDKPWPCDKKTCVIGA